MTIEQEILRELQKGTPIAEIKKKFRSKSQIYEALREYLPEAEKNLNEKQETLRKVEEGLLNADAEVQRVCGDKVRVSAEAAKLQQARDSLTVEVKEASEKRDQLVAEVEGLEAKGYSPSIMKELMAVEARSGPGLLSQVKTAEKRIQMKKEVCSLEKRKSDVEGEVRAIETRKKSIEQLTASEKNRLDDLNLQTTTYKKAMVAVESLLKEGYSVEDIKSLEHGLTRLGIKGDPAASVARLVGGLTKQKTILAVEGKLRKVRLELDETNRGLAAAKSELAATGQATLKTIQEGQKASMQAIANTRDTSTQAIVSTRDTSTQAIVNTRDTSTQAIAETEKRAEDGITRTMDKLEARANESMGKFDAQTQQAADRYKVELKQTVELEKRRAEVETFIGEGLPLVEMLKSPENLKKVPPHYILQLLEKIQSWLEMNLPTASIKPPEYISTKEKSFFRLYSYKLAVLVELAKTGLKQFMIHQDN